MPSVSPRLGLLLIAIASVCWGTTGATMRLLDPLSPFLVGFVRLAIAGPLLFATAFVTGQWRARAPGGGLKTLGIGAALAAYQVCYFSAVPRTSVATTALLAICTAPLMVALLSRLLLGERLTRLTLLAMAAGIMGTGLLVVRPDGVVVPFMGEFAFGALLALGAAVAYAVVAVLSKRLLQEMNPLAIVGLAFPLGAALLSPVAFSASSTLPGTPAQWGLLLYLGVVPTVLAYVLYIQGLRTTSATVSSIVTLLEPLTATTLGFLLFGEHLGARGFAGAALLSGALLLTIGSPLTKDHSRD